MRKKPRAVRAGTFALTVVGAFLMFSAANTRGDDPFDQSKSAAGVWQRAQADRLGPFLNDPSVVVPMDIPSLAITHQTSAAESSLSSFQLESSPGEHVKILSDGRYILYGDLFKTGATYALVQLPISMEIDPYWNGGRLAFMELVSGQWHLRGLWDISTEWESAQQAANDTQRFPVKPAQSPFELEDFDGDRIPEVIMAGEIWRYYQNFYLLRFDPVTHSLTMLASAMDRPSVQDGYVRFYFDSGHRSIFEEWRFAKFSSGKLEEVASWHDGVPYREGDDECLRAQALNNEGRLENYRIDETGSSTLSQKNDEYEIERAGRKIATVVFTRKEPLSAQIDYDRLEKDWLFSHLTKIPADLLARNGKAPSLLPFSKYGSIEVSGDTEFVRRLNTL